MPPTEFPAPEMHRKIILEIEINFPSTTINTNSNPTTTITACKQNIEFFLRNFNYPSFSWSKFSLVCVGHSIMTTASFSDITETTKKFYPKPKPFSVSIAGRLMNSTLSTLDGSMALILKCIIETVSPTWLKCSAKTTTNQFLLLKSSPSPSRHPHLLTNKSRPKPSNSHEKRRLLCYQINPSRMLFWLFNLPSWKVYSIQSQLQTRTGHLLAVHLSSKQVSCWSLSN